MISLNEVATLVNQLSAIKDVSKEEKGFGGIVSIEVLKENNEVQLYPDLFLTEFITYTVEHMQPTKMYRLEAFIFGVKFIALIDVKEIIELKETMPEHHDYIVGQIQLEGVVMQ